MSRPQSLLGSNCERNSYSSPSFYHNHQVARRLHPVQRCLQTPSHGQRAGPRTGQCGSTSSESCRQALLCGGCDDDRLAIAPCSSTKNVRRRQAAAADNINKNQIKSSHWLLLVVRLIPPIASDYYEACMMIAQSLAEDSLRRLLPRNRHRRRPAPPAPLQSSPWSRARQKLAPQPPPAADAETLRRHGGCRLIRSS